MEKDERVAIFMSKDVHKAIKDTAKANNRSMVGQLTHDYLKDKDK